jgi:uncharacterized membrane protein
MMYGYQYGACSNWGFGLIGTLVNILIAVIIIGIVVRIIRRSKGKDKDWKFWHSNAAETLLKERFVKGEISKEEYEEKLKVIRG